MYIYIYMYCRGPRTDQRPRGRPIATRPPFDLLCMHFGTLQASVLKILKTNMQRTVKEFQDKR